ncbi:RHS repeat-associated core domain protein (fragment) [Tenacibaculum litopenaei]
MIQEDQVHQDQKGASSGSSSSSNSSGSSNRSNSGSSNSPGSNGGPNKTVNPKKTNFINKNVTGKGVINGNKQQNAKNTVQPLIYTRIYNYQRNQ